MTAPNSIIIRVLTDADVVKIPQFFAGLSATSR